MGKKYWKWILVTVIILLLIFVISLFCWWGEKKNSPSQELRKIAKNPEIKENLLTHSKAAKREAIKTDNEKTELTVRYQGSFFVENSKETFAIFWPDNCQNAVEIAVASENPILQGKGLKFDAKLKFKISFFGRDVQKNWGAGRKVEGKYWYFNKNNTNFQLEPLPYQWENTQPLNPAFFGK